MSKEYPSPDDSPPPNYRPDKKQKTPESLPLPVEVAVKQMPSPDGTAISYYRREDAIKTPDPEALSKKGQKVIQPDPPKPEEQTEYVTAQTYPKPHTPLKVLTVIDVYGWAYDEGRRGLYKELATRHPDWTLDTASLKEITEGKTSPRDYDVTLVWCWYEVHGTRLIPYMSLLTKLDMRRTIICVAGMYILPLLEQASIYLREVFYMAGNNHAIAEALRKRSRYTRVYDLEYGVDLERFKPTPLPDKFTVGWAGHTGRTLKRYGLAEEICTQADIPLRVAGHISSNNYVPAEEMPQWYDGNSVQLITSESEAHPLVYYEAMAKGRVPVSTLVGDIPSTAEQEVNGFYYPVDAPVGDYVEALRRLRDDPQLLRKLSEAARRTVEEKWRWSRVADSYEEAILEVAGAYSTCMLVSRTDDKLVKAATSALTRQPWEMRVYVDPVTLTSEEQMQVETLIRGLAKKISPDTELVIKPQNVTDCADHHDDVTRAVHTAITEAKYRRTLWVDDDDVMLVDPGDLLYRLGDGIGIVYGNVVQVFSGGRRVHRHGAPITDPVDMANMKGSVVLYNRDAVAEVYRYIDAQKPRSGDSPRDYGYFWDYKIAYWLLRARYLLRYWNRDFSVQNVNLSPGAKRKSLYNDWPNIVKRMDEEGML